MVFDFQADDLRTLLFLLVSKIYENSNPPRTVPSLLLASGQGSYERAQELLKEARFRGFLAEPFTINRLVEKVKACFSKPETVSGG